MKPTAVRKVWGSKEPEAPLELVAMTAQEGDERALSELIRRTQNRLFRFFVLLTNNPPLAQDLCQDTYIRVIEKLRQFQGGSFQSWLLTTARNLFLDHVRSRKNQPHTPITERNDALLGLFREEDRGVAFDIQHTLSQLGPEDKLVLILVDLEGCSYREAAEIVGITEVALTSRLFRARKEFSRIFEKK